MTTTRRDSLLGLCIVAAAVLSSCNAHLRRTAFRSALPDASDECVLIVRPENNAIFDVLVEVLEAQIDFKIVHYTAEAGATSTELRDAARDEQAALVVALGISSARIAVEAALDIPVLFAMVPNYEAILPTLTRNVAGIRLELDPLLDFLKFKMVVPALQRVLVFYSDASSRMLSVGKEALATWSVELVAEKVSQLEEIKNAYDEHKDAVDAVWMQSDPVAMRHDVFDFLVRHSVEDKIPLLASVSEKLAKAGAFAAAGVDLNAIGSQAAALVQRIMEDGEDPAEIGVVAPVGSSLTVNLTTAQKIGIEIPAGVRRMLATVSDNEDP